MTRHSTYPRPSGVEWGVRLLLGAAALCLGWIAIASSLAFTIRERAPERAFALWPFDGRVAAALSNQEMMGSTSIVRREQANRLARRALGTEPTEATALATLGINAQIRGKIEAARRLFAYSEKLTRRDLQARLWSIEDAVARNDIPTALRQYDIALRTSRLAPDLLFPVLEAALTDPSIRSQVRHVMVGRPPWSEHFIGYVGGNGRDARISARFYRELQAIGIPIPDWARAGVISRLVDANQIAFAWAYYASSVAKVDVRFSRDPEFVAQHRHPSVFDWQPAQESGITTSIQRGDRGGFFDFAVASSIGGTLLRQRQMLPAGKYIFEGHATGGDASNEQQPYWTLTCDGARELGRISMPMTADGARFTGGFTVPGGCPSQILSLVARPTDAIGGSSGQVDYAQLKPDK